jgi:hypothetical protein
VTRISPSDPKPGGKTQQEHSQNSGNGKPLKEVCQKTKEVEKEFLQKEMADYLFQLWKLLP